MLTQVDITNGQSDTLSLYILDSSSGYEVRDIQGLDPVNATLTTSTIAQLDGVQPQNARRDVRSIVLKLGLKPDYVASTVQSLRTALYDWFMPKENIALSFYLDDALFVTTQGQVEDFQNAMFSADPEVDITIVCYDPDFYSNAPQVLSAVTADPAPVPVSVGTADGTFESGVSQWTASGTLIQGTNAHSGTHGADLSVTGTPPAQATLRPNTANKVGVTPGSPYTAKMWVLQNTPNGQLHPAIDWSDVNNVYITTTSGSDVTLAAGVWTQLTVTAPVAPAGAYKATYGPTWLSPSTGIITSVDDVEFDAYISNLNIQKIQYPGTTECGVILTVNINRIMSTINVYNTQPDGTLQTFSINGSFAPGDILTLNSIPGQMGLNLTRNGITTSVLYYADKSNMDWPVLKKGENDFYVLVTGAAIPYTLTYMPKYGAI